MPAVVATRARTAAARTVGTTAPAAPATPARTAATTIAAGNAVAAAPAAPARTAATTMAATPIRATAAAGTVPRDGLSINAALSIGADHDRSADFVLLYGPTDEPADWLSAGEALSAGWLTATEHGVSVLPHSAPTEVRSTRRAMRELLADTGYPYLVLRLGTIDPADPGHRHTPRLPQDQLIDRP
jgi:hypothetical protein